MGKLGKIVAGAALAAITIATGGAAGLAIGFSWTTFAGSLILGGLSYALTPKPSKPNFNQNTNNLGNSTVAVRQPNMTRQHVYGHTRITRGYAHMQSTGLNGVLHVILILCEGPLRSINEIWINDYCIPEDWIDSEGNITQGRYAGYMTIINMPVWTADHRLQGTAYLYITMTKNQDVYPSGVPNISAIVEGPLLYDPRVENLRWSTSIPLYCQDFLRSDEYGFGIFSDDIDDTNTAAQANISDEIVNTEAVSTDVVSFNSTNNTVTLLGDLLQYQYGDRVQIVGGTPPTGLSTGVDYYVIPYQIKTTPRIKLAASFDDSMAKTAIDFTTAGSGSMSIQKTGEPRYHGGGIFDTESNLSETLNYLASSMAGRAICIGGYWTLLAGAWRTPDLTLGISDIRGNGIGIKNSLSMSQSFNIVKGLFISSLNFYQNSDYPSARYEAFIEQDNGLESPKDINLPFTNRPTTAMRIAKIELFRGRQDIVYTSDFSTKALQLQPGDTVDLDIDRLGWEEKPFEVTDFGFDVADGNLVTRLTLRETAEAIYDWSSGEAVDYDPAPNTNLPDVFVVYAVSGVFFNSREIGTRDGDVVFTLTLNWDQHPDAFVVENGEFEVQYKLSSEIDWRPSFSVEGNLTETDVLNSSAGIEYDIRIRAKNSLGVRSGWVTLFNAVVGSSGGIGTTYDWDFVYNSVTTFNDWGNVYDTPTTFNDWEYVV
jgi:hypothetical protein